jgi:hypothetical protein
MLVKFTSMQGESIGIKQEQVEALSHPEDSAQSQGAKCVVHLVSGKSFNMKTPFDDAIGLINGKG